MPSGEYLRLETPGTPPVRRGAEPECRGVCTSCFATVAGCFRTLAGRARQDDGPRSSPSRGAQYCAPTVASPQRSESAASSQGECDHEHGALLPKRTATPDPGSSSAAADTMLQELPRHRRTGSGVSARAAWTPPADAGDTRAPTPPLRVAGASGSGGFAGGGSGGAGGGGRSTASGSRSKQGPGEQRGGGSSAAPAAATVAAPAAAPPMPPSSSSSARAASPLPATEAAASSPLPSSMGAMLGEETDDENEDVCPTCLESYTEINPQVFTRCGHSFHVQCIYSWFERSDKCPLCESQIQFDAT